jgi:hypothetical protein
MGNLFGFGSGWRCSGCGSGLPGILWLMFGRREDEEA